MRIKAIETERLFLRRFTLLDAQKVCELCNSVQLYKGTLSLPRPYTIEIACEWIKAQDNNFANEKIYEFAITNKETGELYGCMGIGHNVKNKCGELGYWVGENYFGNGYATEAAQAILAFGFNEKGMHRIIGRHFASNPASGRIMQKLGMKHEGVQRKHILKDGVFEDVVLYGILKNEYNI